MFVTNSGEKQMSIKANFVGFFLSYLVIMVHLEASKLRTIHDIRLNNIYIMCLAWAP